MSVSKLGLLAVLGQSAISSAQLFSCNGDMEPDWDFADAMWEGIKTDNPDTLCWPSGTQDCNVYKDDNAGNAIISYCPPGTQEIDDCWNITELDRMFNSLHSCRDLNAGGEIKNSAYRINCFNNPDFVQGMEKRSSVATEPIFMTTGEVDALMEAAKHSSRTQSPRRAPRMRIESRQQEGDDVWITERLYEAIEMPGDERTITGRLPAGSTYMIQESDSQTISISTSVELSVEFLETFSASVGFSVGADFSFSTTVGITVTVDCPAGQEGVIVFRPRYDHYVGNWRPSGDRTEIWLPTKEQDSEFASGNYASVCQG